MGCIGSVSMKDTLNVGHHMYRALRRPFIAVAASRTLKEEESGFIFAITADTLVITLPKVADVLPGTMYTFINAFTDAGAIITLSPNAADAIHGEIAGKTLLFKASGTTNKDLINTKASATTGNHVTIVSDGLTSWLIISGEGVWASE